ncbi:glycoside hydrolase family 19 protein [Rhizobium leguminosarum]|uniref:glycoside hydrolase family 19 protein n=1 Tax=Rhizobium leguminosarum TaxID=384 RepID=UPI000369116C|nr:glycoside hydrolase family 19 protein [Rhizobium leguminosarum]
MNRAHFYAGVRSSLFGGSLAQSQVEGMEAVLDEASKSFIDPRCLAYMLATAFHETGRTMQAIHERGGADYFFRMYDPKGQRPAVAARLGNTQSGDGVKYAGRGLVQLTGRRNYTLFAKLTGVDLVNDPDRAMQDDIAVRIMFVGMDRGLFTGKKLADYFTSKSSDWVNARRIINGTDRADVIAGYAKDFYNALQDAA